MVLDGFRWFSMVFWKVLDFGGGLNKFFELKTDILKKMSQNVKVLDFGGIINKFFELKTDILIKNVTKCQFLMQND